RTPRSTHPSPPRSDARARGRRAHRRAVRKHEEIQPMSEPLIVIGNGMAAARLVDELARGALARYAVAVIGEEPRLAYNRVLLSALLADEVGFDDIELRPARWWRDRGVTLRYGGGGTAGAAGRRQVK